jgi:thiol-disulfide isomerase/thioredoxin
MKIIRLSSLSHILVLAILSLIVLSVPARLQAQGPTVKVLLFYSKTCPHCHAVMEQVLPPLQEKYGRKLEVRQLEIGDPQNYGGLL